MPTNYCFSHLANDQFINYILQRGGYVIGLGWLNNWREHIEIAGFDKSTARKFYKEFCKEMIFFDAGIDESAESKLKELSEFLDLPYNIVPYELETIQMMIKSVVYEWKLNNQNDNCAKSISEIQSQCAEYSAILDLLGKISSYTNKRDAIERIKEIFMMVLGAQKFKFWNNDYENDSLPPKIKDLFSNKDNSVVLLKEENRFCIKIEQNKKVYGAIDVSNFLFPQYIEKYLNFAIEITRISGMALLNIDHYEKLMDSERELQYLSFHDSLTGLYNRTYLNEMPIIDKETKCLTVFMFDIDKLKYVNDNFGHAEGDKLICAAADTLQKCFREIDTVARIGGDEFLAVLPDCDNQMAEKCKTRINEAIILNNKNIKGPHLALSMSIGFSVSKNKADTLESMIKKADEIMYADKISKK